MQLLFLLPWTGNVTGNVATVTDFLKSRPETAGNLSCLRLYLCPKSHFREFLTDFACTIFSFLVRMWIKRTAQPSSIEYIFFPLFLLADGRLREWALWQGVSTSSKPQGCLLGYLGPSGDLLQLWSNLLGCVGCLIWWSQENIDRPSEFYLKCQTDNISAPHDQ